VTELLRL